MRSAREGNTVANNIRSIGFNWSYMGSRDLGTPHTVNELQPGNSATLIIGTEHDTAENSIAQDSRHSQADTVTLLFERKWRLILVEIERPDVIIAPRQKRCGLR